ncbi:MAG: type II toxin-antitoxin system RelE/ParE family toxin [Salinivirgaceae bacterium]
MKKYRVRIEPRALADIQEITDWYNEKQAELGYRFLKTTIKQINSLSKNPCRFAIRYKVIRCMIIKKFPYMVHFYINQENSSVEILAVISTDRSPEVWKKKTDKDNNSR